MSCPRHPSGTGPCISLPLSPLSPSLARSLRVQRLRLCDCETVATSKRLRSNNAQQYKLDTAQCSLTKRGGGLSGARRVR
eukprot:6187424-Pleurochrysis_carterae.AAC.1